MEYKVRFSARHGGLIEALTLRSASQNHMPVHPDVQVELKTRSVSQVLAAACRRLRAIPIVLPSPLTMNETGLKEISLFRTLLANVVCDQLLFIVLRPHKVVVGTNSSVIAKLYQTTEEIHNPQVSRASQGQNVRVGGQRRVRFQNSPIYVKGGGHNLV
jgi:hypothetical protein